MKGTLCIFENKSIPDVIQRTVYVKVGAAHYLFSDSQRARRDPVDNIIKVQVDFAGETIACPQGTVVHGAVVLGERFCLQQKPIILPAHEPVSGN